MPTRYLPSTPKTSRLDRVRSVPARRLAVTARPEWMTRATCRARAKDADRFFTDRAGRLAAADNEVAKTVCRACPVRPECLQHALEAREPAGVWGGMSTPERDRLLGQVGA